MSDIFWLAWRNAEPFEILGLFSTEAAARAQCTRPSDGIGPLALDVALGDEPLPWEGAYYPVVAYPHHGGQAVQP